MDNNIEVILDSGPLNREHARRTICPRIGVNSRALCVSNEGPCLGRLAAQADWLAS